MRYNVHCLAIFISPHSACRWWSFRGPRWIGRRWARGGWLMISQIPPPMQITGLSRAGRWWRASSSVRGAAASCSRLTKSSWFTHTTTTLLYQRVHNSVHAFQPSHTYSSRIYIQYSHRCWIRGTSHWRRSNVGLTSSSAAGSTWCGTTTCTPTRPFRRNEMPWSLRCNFNRYASLSDHLCFTVCECPSF